MQFRVYVCICHQYICTTCKNAYSFKVLTFTQTFYPSVLNLYTPWVQESVRPIRNNS